MSQNQPFPEHNDDGAHLAAIEERLKQLRPRPVGFDAESIVRAAGQRQVMLPDRSPAAHQSRTPRWVTIAVSWTCGAVAGALLTWLVLMPRDGNEPTTAAGSPATESDEATSFDGESMSAARTTDESDDEQRAAEALPPQRERRPDVPQRSQDEYFVSTHVLDLRRPLATHDIPLMAGSFSLRMNVPTSDAPETVPDPLQRSKTPANVDVDRHLRGRTARPPLSVNPDQLLEELLGTSPTSRL